MKLFKKSIFGDRFSQAGYYIPSQKFLGLYMVRLHGELLFIDKSMRRAMARCREHFIDQQKN